MKYHDKVLELDPEDVVALKSKAEVLLDLGRSEEGLERCDRIRGIGRGALKYGS